MIDRKYLEFEVPSFERERLGSLLRHVVLDCVRRGARRALALLPRGGDASLLSAAESQQIVTQLTDAAGGKVFRLALVVPNSQVYDLFAQVGEAAEQSGLKVMVFPLREEAVRWLTMFEPLR